MIYLKNLLKKRILPIIIVVGGVYLLYLAWWTFSGKTKADTYGDTKASAYEYRRYKTYDRLFFDEIVPVDTFHFQQIVPFYFGKNGFAPAATVLSENDMQNILKQAAVISTDESITALITHVQIDSQRVKLRKGSGLRFLIELFEEVTDLGNGSLSWLGKKTDGYALVVNYALVADTIPAVNPVGVYLKLPGLTSFAEKDSLLPVFHPMLSKYEVLEDSHIFLRHSMVYPTQSKATLWARMKYAVYVIVIIAFILVFLLDKKLSGNEKDEDEDVVSPEKLMWTKAQWTEYYADQADEALQAGDFDKSLKKTLKIIAEDFESESIYITGISAALNLQDFDQADSFIARATALYPHEAIFVVFSAQVAMAQQEYPKAKALFDQAIAKDTENQLAGASCFNAAICSAKMGLKKETLHYISCMPAESFNDPQVLKTLALVYAELKMTAEAKETARRWLVLEPDNAEAHQMSKQLETLPADKAKAQRPQTTKNASPKPEASSTSKEIILQAKQLKEENRHREIIHLLWPVYEQNFTDPTIALYLGEAYNQLEEFGQARNLLQKTLEYYPGNISLFEQLALAQYFNEELEIALPTAQKILQLQPHNIVARRVSADALTNLGDHEMALPIFLELERLNKLTSHNKFNISECYIEREDYETAIEYLKAAMVDTGECEMCWNNIAYCYKKMNFFGDCIDAADKALEINGDYANPMFHKAVALYGLGAFEEAFAWAEKSAELGSTNAAETLADWKKKFEE